MNAAGVIMRDAIEVRMPALAAAGDKARLARWLVAAGARVAAGDIIAEVATERMSVEIEAAADGVIERILVAAGDAPVAAGTVLARLQNDGVGASERGDVAAHGDSSPSDIAGTSSSTSVSAAPQRPCAAVAATKIAMVANIAKVARGDAVGDVARAAPAAKATVRQSLTMRQALHDAIAEEMRADPDVLVMGEGVGAAGGSHGVSEGLLEEFGPRRVVDTPAVGAGVSGLAVGAALAGLKPVVELGHWARAMPALEHILTAARTATMSGGAIAVPIVVRGLNGAGERMGAEQSQCLSAWLAHVPGLKVVAPSSAADAKQLMRAAIRDPGPVVVLEHEALYDSTEPDVSAAAQANGRSEGVAPLGLARIVRAGLDVTLVAYGRGVLHALEAADVLAGEGIEAEVIDLRTLRPLDMESVIASVRKTHRLVTVEEAWPIASVGAEISARAAREAFYRLDAPPQRVTGEDVPMPYAETLARHALPDAEAVAKAVRRVCHGAA